MSKALTTTTPQGLTIKGEPMKQFDTARTHVANIIEHGRRATHESILLGHELNRVQDAQQLKPGFFHLLKVPSSHLSRHTHREVKCLALLHAVTEIANATTDRQRNTWIVAAERHLQSLEPTR